MAASPPGSGESFDLEEHSSRTQYGETRFVRERSVTPLPRTDLGRARGLEHEDGGKCEDLT